MYLRKTMTYDIAPLPGYDPEIGLLLAGLDDSTREWRENLEVPSVEAIVWQPWPDSYSIGALMLHIIECEMGWFEAFAAGIPEDPAEMELLMSARIDQMNVLWPVPPSQPLQWYFELHDRIRARVREPLKTMTSQELSSGRVDSYTLRWIVAHVLEHDSYHGGQAVLLHEMWKAGRTAS